MNQISTFETNPKKGLEITKSLKKGEWIVLDILADSQRAPVLFRGLYNEALTYYTNNTSPNLENFMTFKNIKEAEKYKKDNAAMLQQLQSEVEKIEGVAYSDIWLNKIAPSFIAGYNSDDEQVVSLKIE